MKNVGSCHANKADSLKLGRLGLLLWEAPKGLPYRNGHEKAPFSKKTHGSRIIEVSA